MTERYPRLIHFVESEKLVKRARDFKPLFDYYFENLSMIPDEKQYIVIGEGDRPVGVLDEAFVSEYGQVGVKFVEAGRCWKILEIYENRVYVAPEDDPTGAVPSWVGDEIPVPLEVATEVGAIRREYAESISASKSREWIEDLCRRYPIDVRGATESLKEVEEQHLLGIPIPSDRVITIERWDKYVVIQSSFGHKVNRVLARVVGYLISERLGQSVAVHQDPYRIIMEVDASPELVKTTMTGLVDKDLADLARTAVERSGIFKRRLIHVGKKCGAIAKTADYASISISGLIEALKGTPVYEEAITVIFHDDFDVEATRNVLAKIASKEIAVEVVEPETITPLARIGVEEVSRRGEIVSPERLRSIIRQSTEVRVAGSFLVACCTNCWDYIELKRVGGITPGNCPRCGKDTVGYSTESYETIFSLSLKARSRSELQGKNMKLIDTIKRSCQLVNEYGVDALILMAGRGIRLAEVGSLLARKSKEGGDIIDYVIEGEREALKRRYFAP
jgi:ATP-dependent helicase Lhr and Lhr-like helicase